MFERNGVQAGFADINEGGCTTRLLEMALLSLWLAEFSRLILQEGSR